MSVQQFAKDTYEVLKERIGSPFFGSFWVAFAALNYRGGIVLVSDADFREKFRYLDMQLYPQPIDRWGHLILLPLAVAAFYTFVYPFIDTYLTVVSKWLFAFKTERVLRADRMVPFDRRLQMAYFMKFDKEVEALKETISTQSQSNDALSTAKNVVESTLRNQLISQSIWHLSVQAEVSTNVAKDAVLLIKNKSPSELKQDYPKLASSTLLISVYHLCSSMRFNAEDDGWRKIRPLEEIRAAYSWDRTTSIGAACLFEALEIGRQALDAKGNTLIEVTDKKRLDATYDAMKAMFDSAQ